MTVRLESYKPVTDSNLTWYNEVKKYIYCLFHKLMIVVLSLSTNPRLKKKFAKNTKVFLMILN